MDQISRIGMDTSKRIFQLHGVNAAEQPVLRRKLRRGEMIAFFERLPPTAVAIEACGSAHHWARLLGEIGHDVKLIAPQLRQTLRQARQERCGGCRGAVRGGQPAEHALRAGQDRRPASSPDARAHRERLVRGRTRLGNMIRGTAAEFGVVIATGPAQIAPLLAQVQDDASLPSLARELFADIAAEHAELEQRIAAVDAKLLAWHRGNPTSRKLAAIPGIGIVTASLLVMKTPDPHAFRSGRDFAAWLGLTPKDHSTAGRVRSGGISRAGDEKLRSLLVVGATSVIRHTRIGQARRASPWLAGMLERKPAKLVAIALANKSARVAWKLLATGEAYDPQRRCAQAAAGA